MLSYRHGFHAGNHADVLKHAVYAYCLDYMTGKPKPLFVIDTHAGAGRYDLLSEMSQKTGEWRDGIGRIWGQELPGLFDPFVRVLNDLNPDRQLAVYPGSPEIAARLLRDEDRLMLCELHPTDHADLQARSTHATRRVDGLEVLVRSSPPKERRGLALIDPSYEIKDDYNSVADSIIAAHRRFATGTFILWYPVVDREATELMIARLTDSGIRSQYRVEVALRADDDARGMTASGLMVINPPWTMPQAVEDALPWLARTLDGQAYGKWVVSE